MPTVNGLEACRRFTRTNPGTKLIMVTAFSDTAMKNLALAAGACAFVSKEMIADDLLPAIEQAWTADRSS